MDLKEGFGASQNYSYYSTKTQVCQVGCELDFSVPGVVFGLEEKPLQSYFRVSCRRYVGGTLPLRLTRPASTPVASCPAVERVKVPSGVWVAAATAQASHVRFYGEVLRQG